jgi:thymidylate synthase (FAD)
VTRYPYLDHGYVELIDHMGSDRRIAEAAWVSSNRAENRPDSDVARIVKYLARENHWTPFGQTAITLRFRVPIFIARQLMRSNVGIVWNEESRRYVDDLPQFHFPKVFRTRSESMKQGSGEPLEQEENYRARGLFFDACNQSVGSYLSLLRMGIAPEQARAVLPVATYTTIIGTFNLSSLARVYGLRSGPHAQAEIRELAACIDQAVRSLGVFEVAWGALTGDGMSGAVERGVQDVVNGKVKESAQ